MVQAVTLKAKVTNATTDVTHKDFGFHLDLKSNRNFVNLELKNIEDYQYYQ